MSDLHNRAFISSFIIVARLQAPPTFRANGIIRDILLDLVLYRESVLVHEIDQMPPRELIARIKKDLESVFGEMAPHFVNRRMDDLGLSDSDGKDISFREVETVIKHLRDLTFPLFLNKALGIEKTKTYMRWLNAERPTLYS